MMIEYRTKYSRNRKTNIKGIEMVFEKMYQWNRTRNLYGLPLMAIKKAACECISENQLMIQSHLSSPSRRDTSLIKMQTTLPLKTQELQHYCKEKREDLRKIALNCKKRGLNAEVLM